MTKDYQIKLIELAKEIRDLQDALVADRYNKMQQKINYLIGYILALEESV